MMENSILFILSFAAGVLMAGLVAFFLYQSLVKTKTAQIQADANAMRARLEAELEHEREDNSELLNRIEELKIEGERRVSEVKEDMNKRSEENAAALQKRFDETIAKISAQIKSDTGEMLKARQKEFSETSNISIGQILNPLKENISELRKALEQDGKENAERQGEMRTQIENLLKQSDATRKSADDLAAALKHGTKVQGDWGETILDELLTSQGLTNGIHYDTQEVINDKLRPDVILHLDERRDVIIDSKVSLTAYIDYVNAEDEKCRSAALKAHVDSIKKHIKELSVKDYSSYIVPPKASAGYVIMFVPNVGALWTALNAEPNMWRTAADMNVYMADEQSLYGALKIVNMTWTQVAQTQNHEKVFQLANEMIDRVGQFAEHYENVGRALDKVKIEYEQGKRKLDPQGQSIINTSKKLIKLGAKDSDKHPVKPLLDKDDIPELELNLNNEG